VAPAGIAEAQRAQLGAVSGLLGARGCFLLEHSPSRNLLHVAAVRGRNDPRIKASTPGEDGPGRAFAERRVVREEGVVSVPVLGREAPFGCLVILGAKYAASDALLEALAAQIAAAWEFARLREDSARRNKDLQTAVAGLKSLEKSREELLSNVSQDLKNPLTATKANLTLLSRGKLGELGDKQLKAIQACDRSADRLLRMINDLLLVSRLQSGKMELDDRPFGLKSVADEVLQAVRPLAEIGRVRLKLAPSPEVYVRGDRERMSEALYNLLDNAIHFSPTEGLVEVRVSSDEGLATVTVHDQGPTIPDEDLGRMFDPYYRSRQTEPGHPGRGLGLPIVSKIVHLHGGRIDVSSHPNLGTTFQVSLPMFAGAVAPQGEREGARPGGILVVEDDSDCREVLQQLLEDEGYRVIATTSATEAKAVLGHIRPVMVILDLRLRDEDGRSVLHYIRESEALADVRVYLISGAVDLPSLATGSGPDRIDGYFEKPIQMERLLDTVAQVVRPTRRTTSA
jgi:signal transduction histidine kinase/CheY-like chemotaxis protein